MHGLVKYRILEKLMNAVDGAINAFLFAISSDLLTQGLTGSRCRMQALNKHEGRQIKSVIRIYRWGWIGEQK